MPFWKFFRREKTLLKSRLRTRLGGLYGMKSRAEAVFIPHRTYCFQQRDDNGEAGAAYPNGYSENGFITSVMGL